jgi:predicted RNase H-like nuclease (RuvC/YqgF family)
MEIKIQNQKLIPAINFLSALPLKAKQSRHRTKFTKQLEDRLAEFMAQEKDLLKEHCHLDEEGNPKTNIEGTKWDVKDIEAFSKDKLELYEEELILEGGDAQGMLSTVKKILLDYDGELSGQDALIYDYLCDIFEEGDEE